MKQETSSSRIPPSQASGPVFLLLAIVWLVFIAWQFVEHRHQCSLIRRTLTSRAETLINAVNSSVLSHRWFGPFVQQQLPATLETLARPDDVLALAIIVDGDTKRPFVSGDSRRIDFSLAPGTHLREEVVQVVDQFSVNDQPPMRHSMPFEQPSGSSSQKVNSIVVIDQLPMADQIRREIRNRILIVALGTLCIVALGKLWQFTVRVARWEGQTRLLKAETRHLRELSQAAAGLAHETRNPLGLIRGWTQRMVESGLPDEDQRTQAEAVLEECDRVTSRINQFLAFARPAEVNLEPVVIDEVLAELATLLQLDLEQRGLNLVREIADEFSTVLADQGQLRQVLFNLLSNAIEFAPQGSDVLVRVGASPRGACRMEVIDRGPGVSDDLAETIFEPYVTHRQGGTGLGLSIVRRIAIAHGWDVGCTSSTDSGCTFWVDQIVAAPRS